jgi:hypothetical protein
MTIMRRLFLFALSSFFFFVETNLVLAFVVGPSVRQCAFAMARSMPLFSEPSDTTSDDYSYYATDDEDEDTVDVGSVDYDPTESEALVTKVMDMMPSLSTVTTEENRAAVHEALFKLEALNPTKHEPALSPLINGVWELRYVGGYAEEGAMPSPTRQLALFLYSGGYSPGIFALNLAQKLPSALVDVGDLEIAISRQQPRVEATVSVKLLGGSAESKVSVKARLEVESDIRLRETYESATVLGRDVAIPEPLEYSRDLYVTYVDEDLLIVRDATGVPEVLVRKHKTFSQNWGTEPGEVNDMVPPGDGEDASF